MSSGMGSGSAPSSRHSSLPSSRSASPAPSSRGSGRDDISDSFLEFGIGAQTVVVNSPLMSAADSDALLNGGGLSPSMLAASKSFRKRVDSISLMRDFQGVNTIPDGPTEDFHAVAAALAASDHASQNSSGSSPLTGDGVGGSAKRRPSRLRLPSSRSPSPLQPAMSSSPSGGSGRSVGDVANDYRSDDDDSHSSSDGSSLSAPRSERECRVPAPPPLDVSSSSPGQLPNLLLRRDSITLHKDLRGANTLYGQNAESPRWKRVTAANRKLVGKGMDKGRRHGDKVSSDGRAEGGGRGGGGGGGGGGGAKATQKSGGERNAPPRDDEAKRSGRGARQGAKEGSGSSDGGDEHDVSARDDDDDDDFGGDGDDDDNDGRVLLPSTSERSTSFFPGQSTGHSPLLAGGQAAGRSLEGHPANTRRGSTGSLGGPPSGGTPGGGPHVDRRTSPAAALRRASLGGAVKKMDAGGNAARRKNEEGGAESKGDGTPPTPTPDSPRLRKLREIKERRDNEKGKGAAGKAKNNAQGTAPNKTVTSPSDRK